MITIDNNNFLLNAILPYQTYHHCDSILNSHTQKNFRLGISELRDTPLMTLPLALYQQRLTLFTSCFVTWLRLS